MKKRIFLLVGLFTFAATSAQADEATEQEIKQVIIGGNAYTKQNLRGQEDTVSAEGSLEFWSSGGLLHELGADLAPQEFESFDIDVKHIHVGSGRGGSCTLLFRRIDACEGRICCSRLPGAGDPSLRQRGR